MRRVRFAAIGRGLLAAGLGLLVAAALGLGFAGCKARDNGTSLVVNVLSDLHVPDQIDKIEIDVVSDSHADGSAVSTQTFALTSNASPLGRLAVRPKGSPDFGVHLAARALHAGTVVVSQRAVVQFVPDEAWQIDLFLSSDCAGAQGVCSDPKLVCVRGGSCVTETTVAMPRPFPGNADGGTGGSTGSDGPADTGGADRPADGGRDGGSTLGTWRLMTAPNVPSGATLNKVWPISTSDVWVVGVMGTRGVSYHYDGSAWTAVPTSTTVDGGPSTTTVPTLYGVWAAATDDVWAVGTGGTIIHRGAGGSAAAWVPSVSGSTANLSGIFGLGAGDVTAIGTGGVVLHWNGTIWAPVTSGNITANLFAITSSGPSDLWAVGSGGVVYHGTAATALQPQTHGKTTSSLFAVWASSPTNVWAAGASVALHLAGSTWSLATGTPDTTLDLWGSAMDDVWAVGLDATGTSSAISHYDGSAWTAVTTPAGTGLQSVRGTGKGDIWAVGNGGQILHYQIP